MNPQPRCSNREATLRQQWWGLMLAWQNLQHNKVRLAVAISSIGFASALMFMQLGILGAVRNSARLLYDILNGDVILISPKSLDISFAQPFPRRTLYQAAGVPGVASVAPVYLSFGQWRNPETHQTRGIFVLGLSDRHPMLRIPEVYPFLDVLQQPDTVLMNRFSRPEFGPRELGLKTELRQRTVEIVGLFSLSNTLRADGTVIVSDQNFARLHPGRSLQDINLGLIQLEPQAALGQVVQTLRQVLPSSVEVLSRQEAAARDEHYWVTSTSFGLIATLGAGMGLLVGTVMVYQVLHADVTEHLREYAILKAIGFSPHRLSYIILQEALILAILGFLPGLVISLGLYQLIWVSTRLPMAMTAGRLVLVFGLTLLMCSASGLLAARKVLIADPAYVF